MLHVLKNAGHINKRSQWEPTHHVTTYVKHLAVDREKMNDALLYHKLSLKGLQNMGILYLIQQSVVNQ